jgi:DNA-binding Lrp family transcriptional regulator
MQKILIVEDERIVAADLALTLQKRGYSVVASVNSGEDAIVAATKHRPDLVLMDIRLAGKMDGIEAATKISGKLGTPVVFLTAFSDDKRLEQAKFAKAFGYIVKPFDEKTLNSTIKMALFKKQEIERTAGKNTDPKIGIDAFDKRILQELERDARAPAAEIGRRIRLPKTTVGYRISKLEESGFIQGYRAFLNPAAFGSKYYLVSVKLKDVSSDAVNKVVERIKDLPSCTKVVNVEGQHSLLVLAMADSSRALKSFLVLLLEACGPRLEDYVINEVTKIERFAPYLDNSGEKPSEWSATADLEEYKNISIDDTDRKIIGIITKQARKDLVNIGRETGVDWKVAKYRLQKLEKNGAIAAYCAQLDIRKLGQKSMILTVRLRDPLQSRRIIDYFDRAGICAMAYETLGKYDLVLELRAGKEEMLKAVLDSFKTAFLKQYLGIEISHVN